MWHPARAPLVDDRFIAKKKTFTGPSSRVADRAEALYQPASVPVRFPDGAFLANKIGKQIGKRIPQNSVKCEGLGSSQILERQRPGKSFLNSNPTAPANF